MFVFYSSLPLLTVPPSANRPRLKFGARTLAISSLRLGEFGAGCSKTQMSASICAVVLRCYFRASDLSELLEIRPPMCFYAPKGMYSQQILPLAMFCSSEWAGTLPHTVTPITAASANSHGVHFHIARSLFNLCLIYTITMPFLFMPGSLSAKLSRLKPHQHIGDFC